MSFFLLFINSCSDLRKTGLTGLIYGTTYNIQFYSSSYEDENENKIDLTEEKVFKNEDGTIEKGVIEYLCSRRKTKRSYEYEVKWLNKDSDKNTWISREKLEELGYEKLIQRLDQQEALRSGLATKTLTTKSIEKQLNEMGIDC